MKGTSRGGLSAAPRRFGFGIAAVRFTVFILVLAGLPGIGVMAHAGTATLAVSATVLSKSNCRFNTRTSALNFGALDPATSPDVTATATVPFICLGSAPVAAFSISDDGGLHRAGPGNRRMRHGTATTEFLPYSLTLSPASGTLPKNVGSNLTVTGTVLGTSYSGALAGDYSDTVVLSILP